MVAANQATDITLFDKYPPPLLNDPPPVYDDPLGGPRPTKGGSFRGGVNFFIDKKNSSFKKFGVLNGQKEIRRRRRSLRQITTCVSHSSLQGFGLDNSFSLDHFPSFSEERKQFSEKENFLESKVSEVLKECFQVKILNGFVFCF